eukprot:25716-Pelagomonas_calceolata.AAC.1
MQPAATTVAALRAAALLLLHRKAALLHSSACTEGIQAFVAHVLGQGAVLPPDVHLDLRTFLRGLCSPVCTHGCCAVVQASTARKVEVLEARQALQEGSHAPAASAVMQEESHNMHPVMSLQQAQRAAGGAAQPKALHNLRDLDEVMTIKLTILDHHDPSLMITFPLTQTHTLAHPYLWTCTHAPAGDSLAATHRQIGQLSEVCTEGQGKASLVSHFPTAGQVQVAKGA